MTDDIEPQPPAQQAPAPEPAAPEPANPLPLIVINWLLLIAHLAVLGVLFVAIARHVGLPEAQGLVFARLLINVLFPVILALTLARLFAKPSPLRNPLATCLALSIGLFCCSWIGSPLTSTLDAGPELAPADAADSR